MVATRPVAPAFFGEFKASLLCLVYIVCPKAAANTKKSSKSTCPFLARSNFAYFPVAGCPKAAANMKKSSKFTSPLPSKSGVGSFSPPALSTTDAPGLKSLLPPEILMDRLVSRTSASPSFVLP